MMLDSCLHLKYVTFSRNSSERHKKFKSNLVIILQPGKISKWNLFSRISSMYCNFLLNYPQWCLKSSAVRSSKAWNTEYKQHKEFYEFHSSQWPFLRGTLWSFCVKCKSVFSNKVNCVNPCGPTNALKHSKNWLFDTLQFAMFQNPSLDSFLNFFVKYQKVICYVNTIKSPV